MGRCEDREVDLSSHNRVIEWAKGLWTLPALSASSALPVGTGGGWRRLSPRPLEVLQGNANFIAFVGAPSFARLHGLFQKIPKSVLQLGGRCLCAVAHCGSDVPHGSEPGSPGAPGTGLAAWTSRLRAPAGQRAASSDSQSSQCRGNHFARRERLPFPTCRSFYAASRAMPSNKQHSSSILPQLPLASGCDLRADRLSLQLLHKQSGATYFCFKGSSSSSSQLSTKFRRRAKAAKPPARRSTILNLLAVTVTAQAHSWVTVACQEVCV